jgi:2-polyprenyl-3-methyl-5-hydroxy-6-metoxy-1,4-benzoquinol methylase
MFNSADYWENRYKTGGNSGSGSYNKLAEFKANVINRFIEENGITSLIDYGVGDGNQLKLLHMNQVNYYGIDISPTIVEKCKEMYNSDSNKTFFIRSEFDESIQADVTLSCDVLYHLIEDKVYYDYLRKLFESSKRFVIIYAKNEDKNHKSHVKFRKFTDYILETYANFKLIQHIPNEFPQLIIGRNNDTTSPSDFYIFEKTM